MSPPQPSPGGAPDVPPARSFGGVVVLPVLTVTVTLLAFSGRYGLHGDELYFRMLEPQWWYEDQPPLTVWLSHLAAVTSTHSWVQRIPAALCAGAGVMVAALTPRQLGYPVLAQRIAAWTHGFTVYPLIMGHVLLTATVDLLVWQVVVLLTVRAVSGHHRALPVAGLVAGLGCWNKLLVLALVAALTLGLLVVDRALLRSKYAAWTAAVIAVLGLPQVLAQAAHGWPMAAVSGSLIARAGSLNRLICVPLLAVFVGVGLLPVLWHGLRWGRVDARGPGLLGVALAGMTAITLAAPAQPYYPAALAVAALSVGWGPFLAIRSFTRRWRVRVVANAVISCLMCLPVLPAQSSMASLVARANPVLRDEQGWPGLVEQVLARTDSGEAVVVDSSALAGALKFYGGGGGAPEVVSGHNALWAGGPPDSATVLIVGESAVTRRGLFRRCASLGVLQDRGGDPFLLVGQPIARCVEPIGGWRQAWPAFRRIAG